MGKAAKLARLARSALGLTRRPQSQVIELPAYQNDVLHALAITGGLPGESAKNEVKILRGTLADARRRDAFVQQFYACPPSDPCLCFPPLPEDPTIVRIPLRLPPGQIPTFSPDDIILQNGDTVLIESRDAEVFYTAGMLGGGMHPLPRDRDIDVIEAMSLVGGSNAYGGSGGRWRRRWHGRWHGWWLRCRQRRRGSAGAIVHHPQDALRRPDHHRRGPDASDPGSRGPAAG